MLDDTTMAVPALGMPVDRLGEVVRMVVRGAIEAAVQECGLARVPPPGWAMVEW